MTMQPVTVLRVSFLLPALVVLWASASAGKHVWCTRHLQTPVFQEGDLTGRPDRIIEELGFPARRMRVRADSLQGDDALRSLFGSSHLVRLGSREVTLLLWDQRCLGSTVWRFAVITDGEDAHILAVGGESSFRAPVYSTGG